MSYLRKRSGMTVTDFEIPVLHFKQGWLTKRRGILSFHGENRPHGAM